MTLKTQPKSPGLSKKPAAAATASSSAEASSASTAAPKSPATKKVVKKAPVLDSNAEPATAAANAVSPSASASAPSKSTIAPASAAEDFGILNGEEMEAYKKSQENPESGSMIWMINKFADILKRLEKLDDLQENQKAIMVRIENCEKKFAEVIPMFGFDCPEADLKEGVLLGFGNPLLDISVTAEAPLLRKFGLKPNDAIIATAKHEPLFDILQKKPYVPRFLAGGATQNSIRVAQWLLRRPKATSFLGCVGDDKDGERLEEVATEEGVHVMYQRHPTERTGSCAALITGHDRSLVTSLGAALKFTHKFLTKPENWSVIEKAEVIYIGGFVFDVSVQAIEMLCKHAAENDKVLVMNLSAPFLIKYFADKKLNILQYVDVLFGNQDEAAALAKGLKLGTTTAISTARKVMALQKANEKRKRSVIFTGGRDPTVVGWEGGEPFEDTFDPVPKEKIKDTNACGDAFVGGFLSQLVRKKDVKTCLKCGNYAASVIIQHDGCSFPEVPTFRVN